MLGASRQPLVEAYDLAMFDLDGVVYIESAAVPGAPDRLARLRAGGSTQARVHHQQRLPPTGRRWSRNWRGSAWRRSPHEVVTSAQAAAHLLVESHGEGGVIACLGAAGLEEALRDVGLEPAAVDD